MKKKAEQLAADLYGLKLGDVSQEGDFSIIRVPGGWLFCTPAPSLCFVPYSDEFKEVIPIETVRIKEEQIVKIVVDDS